ncbi:alcohol dehydrogenase catalytic domain-containing protein [Nocardia asteroides]|uniref:alcohol dehydrogenase catalytic domain-containing protein n=1 Tax=Nocardia asteroides TaxID=1824 RepID=UPI001E33C69E|nr:alcohol dehydrogenase catalytic domain-containing protein [Nocardia asteroides]UGT58485.1 alcohol dehydrogenase catalytic domain-containing protein [Nocardia asteroides]
MRAMQLTAPGTLELRTVPIPELGPDDLLLRVGAAGICHSDSFVLGLPYPMGDRPLTLGHEIAGTIETVGTAVADRVAGERGIVYLCWSCGVCRECLRGNENVCLAAGRTAMPPCPGLGPDGGMAEYVRIPARSFVPIGDLDFAAAAPLADAALTPMHAIRGAMDQLQPGGTAVAIGIGGLGHVAVQLLKALTETTVIAVDVDPDKLALATACGADQTLLAGEGAAAAILDRTDGRGAEAVFDFVGSDATAKLAVETVAPNGAYRMVGLAGGVPGIDSGPAGGPGLPWGATVRKSYGGTRNDLIDVVALAATGAVRAEIERFDLADARTAFDRLDSGTIRGRAVLIP